VQQLVFIVDDSVAIDVAINDAIDVEELCNVGDHSRP
jgi:hypothetical protein